MNPNRTRISALLLATCIAGGSALAQMPAAQPAPLTRQEAKAERDAFLATHTWDEESDVWTLKPGMQLPPGVKARSDVKAERDAFLSRNHWDESKGGWVPETAAPRNLGQMTREQVRAETAAFTRTHRWDEETETWTLRQPARR